MNQMLVGMGSLDEDIKAGGLWRKVPYGGRRGGDLEEKGH